MYTEERKHKIKSKKPLNRNNNVTGRKLCKVIIEYIKECPYIHPVSAKKILLIS